MKKLLFGLLFFAGLGVSPVLAGSTTFPVQNCTSGCTNQGMITDASGNIYPGTGLVDGVAAQYKASVTPAGTPGINALAIQGVATGVPLPLSAASGAYVAGALADGAEVTIGTKADAANSATNTTPVSAISILKEISALEQAPASRAVTNAGTFAVQATLQAAATTVVGTVRSVGSAGAAFDGVIGNATAPANMVVGGLVFNASPLTLTGGQSSALQGDASGYLNVHIQAGGGTGGTALADNAAWTASTTNFTPGGCEYTSAGATALTTGHAGTVACTIRREQFADIEAVGGTASFSNYGTAPGTVPALPVDAFITNTVAISASALPLGTGAATAANQATEIASLATIATQTGAAIPAGANVIGGVTLASGAVASGAYASGAFASGAYASGSLASGAVVDITNFTGSLSATAPTKAAYLGGLASTSDQAAATNGQMVGLEVTPNGKQIVQPWALTPNLADGGGSATGTGTFTILAASGSASLKEYLVSLQCGRSDAGTTAITVAVTEGTKTRTFVVPNNGGGGGNNIQLTTPISFAANTAVTAAFSAGVTTGYCNAEGFYAP